jgi:hypothetical protein
MIPSPGTETAVRRSRAPGWLLATVWVITFLGARFVLDRDLDLPTWAKVGAALAPVIPTALFLRAVVLGVRDLDELHRRVHLEALVVAYPVTMLFLMTLGLLDLAIELPPEDWGYRHVWPYLVIFYIVGLAISWRRYK